MATLYIAELPNLGTVGIQPAEVAPLPPVTEQTVAISGASNPSAAFNAKTEMIRVHTDSVCSIVVGAAPVATTANMRMAAGQTEYFAVAGGNKIAVIANT